MKWSSSGRSPSLRYSPHQAHLPSCSLSTLPMVLLVTGPSYSRLAQYARFPSKGDAEPSTFTCRFIFVLWCSYNLTLPALNSLWLPALCQYLALIHLLPFFLLSHCAHLQSILPISQSMSL